MDRSVHILLLTVLCSLSIGAQAQVADTAVTGQRVVCTDGFAAGFPCRNVDLLAFLPISDLGPYNYSVNDLWGWTDPETGKEYALVGRGAGTAFVDISDPVHPVFVGWLPTHNTQWAQDLKVYANHVFITGSALGMQVFDLTLLRAVTDASVTFSSTAHYTLFSGAHNLAINEETGYAYLVGGGGGLFDCGGGIFMINIQDPTDPQGEGCFGEAGSPHDTQCVVYRGPDTDHQGREICFASNRGRGLAIVDVTDKQAPFLISLTEYPRTALAHQGWLTDTHRYFFLGDESDESNAFPKTRTIIWDLKDLDAPAVLQEYYGPTTSIDHNQYVVRNYVFQANYTSGLRILDVRDISRVGEVGFFDTYPEDNQADFQGAWSNYPFFDSGVVIVSSQEEGLFILQPTELSFSDIFSTEITDFDATVTQSTATLSWKTITERDNFGFEIEHQQVELDTEMQASVQELDEQAWQAVGFVAGHGTTQESQSYTYRIEHLERGNHAFRLKQQTYAGAVTYSAAVEVFSVPGTHVVSAVYPNPFAERAQFSLVLAATQNVQVDLFDALGRRVALLYEGVLAENAVHRIEVDASGLPAGLYLVRASGEHFRTTQKVLLVK